MNPGSKITPAHLEHAAVVYIRQSSMRQVEENLESQDLQYQLAQRAQSLGWAKARIQIIDDDLGKSAISSANRSGFQNLAAAVGLGQVGIILVTDVSRLARNCGDWYRLLDLASVYGTLISDASGIYDPRIYDDRLLLGLKGTFSEAQWYSLRTQLGAAKLNKAKRGELHLRLPVGLVRVSDERVALHPDAQVQSAIRHVFAEFERLGSAHKVLRALRDEGLSLPRREGSSWMEDVIWVRPTFAAIYALLKNPAYAGAYAYGKQHRTHLPGDAHKVVTLPEWPVLRPEAFPGYIPWDTYLANQRRLAENAAGIQWKRGAPREGLALLQGMAICARCGRLLHVHYTHASAYVCDHATQQYGDRRCQTFTVAYIDPCIEQLFLQAVQPARLQAALAALDQIEAHRQSLLAHWRVRLERARYDSDLPARWQRAAPADRKRLLRCLIQDVTLDSLSRPGFSRLLVRWHTGATTTLDVPRPRHGIPPATAVADRLRALAQHLSDDQIAERLNAEGFPTATGLSWTLDRVRAVRRRHRIPTACPLGTPKSDPRGDGLLKSTEVAKRLGVHPCMISQWFRDGLISGLQRKPGGWLWVRLTGEDLHRLDGSAHWLPEMIPFVAAPRILGVSPAQLRAMLVAGHLTAFRLHQQDAWRWFLLPTNHNPLS